MFQRKSLWGFFQKNMQDEIYVTMLSFIFMFVNLVRALRYKLFRIQYNVIECIRRTFVDHGVFLGWWFRWCSLQHSMVSSTPNYQMDIMHLINRKQNGVTITVGPFGNGNRELFKIVSFYRFNRKYFHVFMHLIFTLSDFE